MHIVAHVDQCRDSLPIPVPKVGMVLGFIRKVFLIIGACTSSV